MKILANKNSVNYFFAHLSCIYSLILLNFVFLGRERPVNHNSNFVAWGQRPVNHNSNCVAYFIAVIRVSLNLIFEIQRLWSTLMCFEISFSLKVRKSLA